MSAFGDKQAQWLAAALLSCWSAAPAAAQQGAASPPVADPQAAVGSAVQGVTVTAHRSDYASGLDVRSYSLGSDLKSSTGALADVLRDVPSVQVDIEGNVSLRGNADVTILVDGKPSTLFSGPGRAQAIQAMSAAQYERVEVMTNPSAGQPAEGSGGIINLVSRKARPGPAPSSSLTFKAQAGSGDRYDLGGSGSYTASALALGGVADYRRSRFDRTIETRYGLLDPASGALSPADQVQRQAQHDEDLTLSGSLGYELDANDHLDASISSENYRQARPQVAAYQTQAASGPLALDYTSAGAINEVFASTSESLGVTRTLPGTGHSLSAKLSLSQGHDSVGNAAAYAYTEPVQPGLDQVQRRTSESPQLDLKIDYKTTLPNKAKLTAGYEGKFDWQTARAQGMQGVAAADATADPTLTERFAFDQQVHALYATYEQSIGKLAVQPGLRLESATLGTDLASAAEAGRQAYIEAYPSLHLDYALSDNVDIRASYGRRVQRPDPDQLDPFRIESSLTLYRAGNPGLRPAITESWELGYEYRKQSTDLQATFFYRDKSNAFTNVQTDLGGDVLLSTWDNLGKARDAGLELVLNRDVLDHLTVHASAELLHSEVHARNLGFSDARKAFISSGHVTVSWQASAHDTLQLGAQASGRELTAQGYYGGSIFSDLSWRHQISRRITAAITAQDPFGLSRRTIETDTSTLLDVQKRKFKYSAAFLGLTYTFGGAPKQPLDNSASGAHPAGS